MSDVRLSIVSTPIGITIKEKAVNYLNKYTIYVWDMSGTWLSRKGGEQCNGWQRMGITALACTMYVYGRWGLGDRIGGHAALY